MAIHPRLPSPAPPIALTIAGSDSGGGAGIQADLKTFHAYGVYGTSAVTAITAQNTLGVHGIHPVPASNVRSQIDAVVTDLRPDALKTGMLASAELVHEVADAIETHELARYVMDPVMVATSGRRLLDPEAERGLVARLLPLAALATPNLLEAAVLVGEPVDDLGQMRRAAVSWSWARAQPSSKADTSRGTRSTCSGTVRKSACGVDHASTPFTRTGRDARSPPRWPLTSLWGRRYTTPSTGPSASWLERSRRLRAWAVAEDR